MNIRKKSSPKLLYPMVGIESLDPKTLERTVCKMKENQEIPPIKVSELHGYYIILKGNYEVLAANIIGKESINIEIVPWNEQKNWISEKTLIEQLQAVGMNALYDFEALGGFKYSEYPTFYNKN